MKQPLNETRETTFRQMILRCATLPEITRVGALIGRYCQRFCLKRSLQLNQTYFLHYNKIISLTDSENL